ncbi:MAG: hypothetical protein IJV98_00515 [Clostridia bacterium]|nr:hypothetical protein [Clostridia bacterium]
MMQHYDLRVIEDCLVFSYEVERPNYPKAKRTQTVRKQVASNGVTSGKHTSRRERKRRILQGDLKRWLMRILFILLAPAVMAADLLLRAATLAFGICRQRPTYITTLATVSFVIIVSGVIGLL